MTNAPLSPLRPSRHIEALLALGAEEPQCARPDDTPGRDPMVDPNSEGNKRRVPYSPKAHPVQ